MRRFAAVLLALFLISWAALPPLAMAAHSDYVGDWVAVATDRGSGIEEADPNADAADQLRIVFLDDGTLSTSFWNTAFTGTWEETDGGISATLNGQSLAFRLENGQLVNEADGTITYFERTDQKPTGGGQPPTNSADYTGRWVSTSLDMGDGELLTEYEGQSIQGMMIFQINGDGTLHLDSAASGDSLDGTWVEIDGGIAITIQDHTENMTNADGKLTIGYNGTTVYLERDSSPAQGSDLPKASEDKTPSPKPRPTSTPSPTAKPRLASTPSPTAKPKRAAGSDVDCIGSWSAVLYQTEDTWYDARMMFPQGCTLEILADGTGTASIAGGYTESFIWSLVDGGLTIDQSNLFTSAAWDAKRGELEFQFGVSGTTLVFARAEEQAQAPVGNEEAPVQSESGQGE